MAFLRDMFLLISVCFIWSLPLLTDQSPALHMSQIESFLPTELLNIKTEIFDAFMSFKKKFNKVYASAEEEMERFWKFVINYGKIILHNRKNNSFDMELNRFADMVSNFFYLQQILMENICLDFKR